LAIWDCIIEKANTALRMPKRIFRIEKARRQVGLQGRRLRRPAPPTASMTDRTPASTAITIERGRHWLKSTFVPGGAEAVMELTMGMMKSQLTRFHRPERAPRPPMTMQMTPMTLGQLEIRSRLTGPG
jgi:hypothetical protein